jgi:hypothetical protein
MAVAVINIIATEEKGHAITRSGLVSLMEEPIICTDISFIAGFAKLYLDPHMLWNQTMDPNIGEPGFLCCYQAVWFAVSVNELQGMVAF